MRAKLRHTKACVTAARIITSGFGASGVLTPTSERQRNLVNRKRFVLGNRNRDERESLKADLCLPIQVRLRRISIIGPRTRLKTVLVKPIQTMLDVDVGNIARTHVCAALLGPLVPPKGHDAVRVVELVVLRHFDGERAEPAGADVFLGLYDVVHFGVAVDEPYVYLCYLSLVSVDK
jgi:hypothetical protein